MRENFWKQVVIAAALVLLAGGVVALSAEQVEVKILKLTDDSIEVNYNGETELVKLDDLADGETRTYGTDDGELTVRRDGDQLKLSLDGEQLISGLHGVHHCQDADKSMVWVAGDGAATGDHKVVVIKAIDDTADTAVRAYRYEIEGDLDHPVQIDIEQIREDLAAEGLEELDLSVLDNMIVSVGEGGELIEIDSDHQIVTSGLHDQRVRYRCPEDGSELLVEADKATADTYICPATGCVMERVEQPQHKVIAIKVFDGDDDGDDDSED